MTFGLKGYQGSSLITLIIFLLSGVTAIFLDSFWILLVPFGWLLLPLIFQYTIVKTEHFFWLLLICLPLSTEMPITQTLGIDFPDEIWMVLLTGLGIIKIIHEPKWLPEHLLKDPLFFLLLIALGWIAITCFYATEPLLALKYLLAKIWYVFPFVILPQVLLYSRNRIGNMAICILVPMLFVVIQTLVRHSFYGFSFVGAQKVLFPFFRNHVNYSAMLVALLPAAWCIWKLTPTENAQRKWVFVCLLLALIALVFAYSRGAWLALLLGMVSVWIIRKKRMGVFIIAATTAILLSLSWLVADKNFMRFAPDHDHTIFHTDFGEHMKATVAFKDVSTAERFYRWVAGARMLAEKPMTGFGPNSFYLHYRPYTVNSFETWVSDNPEHSTVHNYFLLIALEQGIVGLILFCLLFFGMLLRLQKMYHHFQSRFYQMISLTTAVTLVIIGTINSMSDMIETDKIGSLFWLCLGMVILLEKKLQDEKLLLT